MKYYIFTEAELNELLNNQKRNCAKWIEGDQFLSEVFSAEYPSLPVPVEIRNTDIDEFQTVYSLVSEAMASRNGINWILSKLGISPRELEK